MSMEKIWTTHYRPQCNGLTESFNKSLGNILSHYVSSSQVDWDRYISLVQFTYNVSIHESHGYTPFFLAHGHDANLPADVTFNIPKVKDAKGNYAQNLQEKMKLVRNIARQNLEKSQARSKKYYDSRHRPVDFKVGDLVLKFSPRLFKGKTNKFLHRFSGPFRILKIHPSNTAFIESISDSRITETANMKFLKHFYERNLDSSSSELTESETGLKNILKAVEDLRTDLKSSAVRTTIEVVPSSDSDTNPNNGEDDETEREIDVQTPIPQIEPLLEQKDTAKLSDQSDESKIILTSSEDSYKTAKSHNESSHLESSCNEFVPPVVHTKNEEGIFSPKLLDTLNLTVSCHNGTCPINLYKPISCVLDRSKNYISLVYRTQTVTNTNVVLMADPFKLWRYINVTHMCSLNYVGPELCILDKVSGCITPLREKTNSLNLVLLPDSKYCSDSGPYDRSIEYWKQESCRKRSYIKLDELVQIKPTTESNLIYCFNQNITVFNQTIPCPSFPFSLPTTTSFLIQGMKYAVEQIRIFHESEIVGFYSQQVNHHFGAGMTPQNIGHLINETLSLKYPEVTPLQKIPSQTLILFYANLIIFIFIYCYWKSSRTRASSEIARGSTNNQQNSNSGDYANPDSLGCNTNQHVVIQTTETIKNQNDPSSNVETGIIAPLETVCGTLTIRLKNESLQNNNPSNTSVKTFFCVDELVNSCKAKKDTPGTKPEYENIESQL